MGTSTAHPSPKTKEWQEARDQYRHRQVNAGQLVRAVARAIDPTFEAAMAGEPVARCLDVLLRHADEGSLDSDPDASRVGYRVREAAREELSLAGTSRQAETALDAVFLTALAQVHARREEELPEALPPIEQQFVAHYIAGVFKHLVARDSSEFVGGDGLPTVGDRSALSEQCERMCVDAVYAADAGPLTGLGESEGDRARRIAEGLAPVVADVLDRLRKGRARP